MGVESLSSNDSRSDKNNREALHSSNGFDLQAVKQPVSLSDAERFCRKIATGQYENFLVASAFLPKKMRQPFYNIYAFCRTADDIADLSPSSEIAKNELIRWREMLRACFEGDASEPIFVALRDTAAKFSLPMAPFDDLLTAFLQDQVKTRYETFAELIQYCRYSANPVGRIVLQLAGVDSDRNFVLSDSICTGLQLANHWQDVARDYQAGRVYLPSEDLNRFDIDVRELFTQSQRGAFRDLIMFQCDRARGFLRDGLPLAEHVPSWLANDVRLFAHGGLATLDEIAGIDHDVLSRRPVVSKSKQVRLMVAAFFGCL